METAGIRRRVRRTIAEARAAARARRQSAALAEVDGRAVLAGVATEVFKTVASALKAEGYVYHVSTPADAVRLSSDSSSDNFIELALDTSRETPALVGRIHRAWGHRVLSDERVVAEHPAVGNVDAETVLEFLLRELTPFVER